MDRVLKFPFWLLSADFFEPRMHQIIDVFEHILRSRLVLVIFRVPISPGPVEIPDILHSVLELEVFESLELFFRIRANCLPIFPRVIDRFGGLFLL